MNEIKVPYVPIERFKFSEITEHFSEEEEEIKELIDLNPSLGSSDGEKFCEDITLILLGMGMEKYVKLFQEEKIQLDTFIQLSESDLEEIGITNKEDRSIITQNLSFHRTDKNNYMVFENHTEDLQIVKNISHQLLLLQNYCIYLNLQMKKQKLMDFRINKEESACTYLKAFAESALTQSQILCCRMYDVNGSEALINKLIKAYNMALPKALLETLPKKKKKRSKILKVMIIIGFSSFFVITGKYLIRRW